MRLDFGRVDRIDLLEIIEVADLSWRVGADEAVPVEREMVADRPRVAHGDVERRIFAGVHFDSGRDEATIDRCSRQQIVDLRAHAPNALFEIVERVGCGRHLLAPIH
jgi:hypothetical protein